MRKQDLGVSEQGKATQNGQPEYREGVAVALTPGPDRRQSKDIHLPKPRSNGLQLKQNIPSVPGPLTLSTQSTRRYFDEITAKRCAGSTSRSTGEADAATGSAVLVAIGACAGLANHEWLRWCEARDGPEIPAQRGCSLERRSIRA